MVVRPRAQRDPRSGRVYGVARLMRVWRRQVVALWEAVQEGATR